MTSNTNPSAQPVDDGEALSKAFHRLRTRALRDAPIYLQHVSECENEVKALLAQAYQSGYAAAVGDAVAVAPKRQPILGINLDEPSKSIERARREGSNKGIDHYRTAIEALASPKHTNVTEEQ